MDNLIDVLFLFMLVMMNDFVKLANTIWTSSMFVESML